MSLTQTSFTVRENETLVIVCANFTKYNIRPDCPMEVVININFATLNNTAGMHTMYMYCSQYSHNVICSYIYGVCVFVANPLLMAVPRGDSEGSDEPPPATGKGPLLHSLVVVYHSRTLHGVHA